MCTREAVIKQAERKKNTPANVRARCVPVWVPLKWGQESVYRRPGRRTKISGNKNEERERRCPRRRSPTQRTKRGKEIGSK